ncbi:MAG: SPOR domain-containing protein [Gammaproteobacteria bacterium]|nr:SPOR domain-containing protein [Gammaproteobacteria bacterium]
MAKLPQLTVWEKVIIGALGGLSAVCVKFLGQDYALLVEQGANLSADQWFAFKVGYFILTPILIFLGAVLAWVSDEPSRIKLLAIAIAAPAMITTWSGGIKTSDTVSVAGFSFISSAHAGEQSENSEDDELKVVDPMKRTAMNWWGAGVSGIKMFFGYGKEIKSYYVVAGSFKDKSSALKHAQAINNRGSIYRAHVGSKARNGFYPVLLGEAVTFSSANRLKKTIVGQRIIHDAYLVSSEKIKPLLDFDFQ